MTNQDASKESLALIEAMLDKNDERQFLNGPSLASYGRDLMLLSNEFETAGERELEERCHAALGRVVAAQNELTSPNFKPSEFAQTDGGAEDPDPGPSEEPIGGVTLLEDGKAHKVGDIYKGGRVVVEAVEPGDEDDPFAPNPAPGSDDLLLDIQTGLQEVLDLTSAHAHAISSSELLTLQTYLLEFSAGISKLVTARALTGDEGYVSSDFRTDSETAEAEDPGVREAGSFAIQEGESISSMANRVGQELSQAGQGDEIDKAHAELATKKPQGDAALTNALGRVADMLQGRDKT